MTTNINLPEISIDNTLLYFVLRFFIFHKPTPVYTCL